MNETKSLRVIAENLDIIAGDLNRVPCSEHGPSSSCIRKEGERPFDSGTRRAFAMCDSDRMCRMCAAFWYASMAVMLVNQQANLDARVESAEP